MGTYLLGPFLALLPKQWRKALSFSSAIDWGRATAISGFAEFILALAAFANLYFTTMNLWVNRGLQVALNGKNHDQPITDHAVGAAALLIWVTHPLTWALAYFAAEGVLRFCAAAFSENILGTLPLFLIAKCVRAFSDSPGDEEMRGAASSFFGAVGDKVLEARLPAYVDEIVSARNGDDEILEIRASRRKPDWDPPRVVRMQDRFYRLEACSKGATPRPFRYTLRRLSAGVPGRSVLIYEATHVLVTQND
jgi:hypothetical protein